MTDFWNKQNKPSVQKPWEQSTPQVEFDEQAVAELQESPESDIFEEEEEDTVSLMTDANLRLEQGRLYQMILQNDIFGETNADPKAIRNVQREIRKFVRERMETMLGIRQETFAKEAVISSPFNDVEVVALKMLASKVTKGASEDRYHSNNKPEQATTPPKKDGITAISGSLRKDDNTIKRPVAKLPSNTNPDRPNIKQPAKAKSAIVKEEEPALTKPIDQMTPQELVDYNKAAEERNSRKKAAMPSNLIPHPDPRTLEMMYAGMASGMNIKLVPHE